MGTKGAKPHIQLARCVRDALQYASAEVYPKESLGWLLGEYVGSNQWEVQGVVPVQRVKVRSQWRVEAHHYSHAALDVIEHSVIGDFHSHPNALATPSHEDRCEMVELETEGWCFLVASIYPSKRRAHGFNFRLAGYTAIDGRLRRATIV